LNDKSFRYCRTLFEKGAYSNIDYLIRKRYSFIIKNIDANEKGIEFGAGAGLSSFFLKDYNIIVTDYCESEWLDIKNVNAEDSVFDDCSFDYIIMSNVIHHLDKPKLFFEEALRILKPGGRIIVIEPYSSILLKVFLAIKKHEQINYTLNPLLKDYSFNRIAKTDIDGNNAVGRLLFEDSTLFENQFPNFQVTYKSYEECMVFVNSGGQYVKSLYVPLPFFLLKLLNVCDRFLITVWKKMFALGLYVVIRKK